jgi:hypothetical protein
MTDMKPVGWAHPTNMSPDMVSRVKWSDDCTPLFTAEQIAEARRLEREKLVKLCDSISYRKQLRGFYMPEDAKDLIKAIRAMEEETE